MNFTICRNLECDHVACPVNNMTSAWGDSEEPCNTSVNSARTLD